VLVSRHQQLHASAPQAECRGANFFQAICARH